MKKEPLKRGIPPSADTWRAYQEGKLSAKEAQAVEAYELYSPLGAAAIGKSPVPDTPQEVPWGQSSPPVKTGRWNYFIVFLLLLFVAWSAYRYWQHRQSDRVFAAWVDQLPGQVAMRSDVLPSPEVVAARTAVQKGQTNLALSQYEAHLNETTEDYAIHMEAAKLALESGETLRAKNHYEAARFNSDIYYGSATFGLILVAIKEKDEVTARQLIEELQAAPELSPELRQSTGRLLQQMESK